MLVIASTKLIIIIFKYKLPDKLANEREEPKYIIYIDPITRQALIVIYLKDLYFIRSLIVYTFYGGKDDFYYGDYYYYYYFVN
jgi:hypothetical protein